MLRASIEKTTESFNWESICQDAGGALSTGITMGNELIALTDALLSGEQTSFEAQRDALSNAAGAQAAARAIGVVANFEMMNRLLDATGIPIPRRFRATAEHLQMAI